MFCFITSLFFEFTNKMIALDIHYTASLRLFSDQFCKFIKIMCELVNCVLQGIFTLQNFSLHMKIYI